MRETRGCFEKMRIDVTIRNVSKDDLILLQRLMDAVLEEKKENAERR